MRGEILFAIATTWLAFFLAIALIDARLELQTCEDQDWLEVCGDMEPIDWDLACYSIELRKQASD